MSLKELLDELDKSAARTAELVNELRSTVGLSGETHSAPVRRSKHSTKPTSPEVIKRIAQLHSKGMSQGAIARKLQTSATNVGRQLKKLEAPPK